MDETLKKLAEKCFETSRDIVLRNEEVVPVFFARNDKGEASAFMTPWGDEYSKIITLKMVQLAFALHGATSYVAVSEAWVVSRKGDDAKDRLNYGGPPPSECPDREERLVFTCVDKDGAVMAMAKLGKDKDANRTCGPLEWMPYDGDVTGRMVSLLPPGGSPKLPPELLAKAMTRLGELGVAMQPIGTIH